MFNTIVYHLVDNHMPADNSQKGRMYVTEDMFETHIQCLKDAGCRFIDLAQAERQLETGNRNGEKDVLITFDDGYQNTIEKALPILVRHNVPAAMSICGSYISPETRVNIDIHVDKNFANIVQIERWLDSGNAILAHTYSHLNLTHISPEACETELMNDLEAISAAFRFQPNGLAYPFGSVNDQVINIVKKFYKYGFTTDRGKSSFRENRYRLSRICAENNCSADFILDKLTENGTA